MLLDAVREQDGWLLSLWRLTSPTGWEPICQAVQAAYPYFETPEVLTDGERADVACGEDVMRLEEAGRLTVRGLSTVIRCPLTITFYNQTDHVELALPQDDGEFAHADYERFNRSLCQFMDSVELLMNR